MYYGFSSKFIKWGEEHINGFELWMGDMKRLLDQDGVVYKGKSA